MTDDEKRLYFLKVAPKMFGRFWKTHAAVYLGKTPETIMNWRKGRTPIDDAIITLLQECEKRHYVYDRKHRKMKVTRHAEPAITP